MFPLQITAKENSKKAVPDEGNAAIPNLWYLTS